MTETLFRTDAYARTCEAFVTAVNDRGGIVLDRTILYAAAGGQPGDGGALTWEGGVCRIATTVYDADKTTIVHVPAEGSPLPAAGLPVHLALDWDTRHRYMRVHTALHLLCSLVQWPVTGGQIGVDDGRLDFDIADMAGIDKETLTAALNALVDADHPVTTRWITDAELEASAASRAHHERQTADGIRQGPPRRDRQRWRRRPPALRRHARRPHRRDRPPRRHQNREQGQAEPAHPRRARLNVQKRQKR